ncbi:butyrate kinase [Aeromonas sp. CU5]|uniref:butyrate kinase n=1 Tax=Aeromonas sp. CU5 TaxID=2033033 RepID=UPI000BFBD2B4|nr:butyrate kinase [Aeromonas sp. CU5]ATL91580.1 butyrate kinase [Aeromonas sp. CU5]
MRVLAVNPGGMSTKIAVYENKKPIFLESISHSFSELARFESIADQKEYRKKLIINTLSKHNIKLDSISGFVGRGGMVRNLESGVYRINQAYLNDAIIGLNGQHASNLGGILAYEIAKENDVGNDAYIVDPVMVDEYDDIAKLSGMAGISRVRSFHALNQKAVARRYAREAGKDYHNINLIVAHLGSGVSVGAHKHGRVIDVNSALGGDGPMSPERAGGVPPLALIDLCFSGKYSYKEMYKKLIGEGGVYSYLETKDMQEVEDMVRKGDENAKLIMEGMAYQIAKEIGALSAVLYGSVDAIILTGSVAHSGLITDWISSRVSFICKNIMIYPGEDEMQALVEGVIDALNGDREILEY